MRTSSTNLRWTSFVVWYWVVFGKRRVMNINIRCHRNIRNTMWSNNYSYRISLSDLNIRLYGYRLQFGIHCSTLSQSESSNLLTILWRLMSLWVFNVNFFLGGMEIAPDQKRNYFVLLKEPMLHKGQTTEHARCIDLWVKYSQECEQALFEVSRERSGAGCSTFKIFFIR